MRAIALLGALALAGAPILAAEPECRARPAWCLPGYVCLPTACAAESAADLFLLSSEIEALKLKAPRHLFRLLGATCGPAASLEVDRGQTTFAGTISCAIGLTFAP
jgi:hypothetical protein